LSGLKPVEALYSKIKFGGKNNLSKSLVVLQFSLATLFIIATLFTNAQFNFLTKSELGYNDKNLVEFVVDKAIIDKPLMDVCKTAFADVPGVEKVAYANVGKFGGKTQAGGREFAATYEHIDENYLPTLQTQVLAGRNFSAASDSLNLLPSALKLTVLLLRSVAASKASTLKLPDAMNWFISLSFSAINFTATL